MLIPRIVRKIVTSGLDYSPFITSKVHGDHQDGVCFTFDDGPHEKYTLELMDVLLKHDVHGIFFCIGENILKNYKVAEKLHLAGHMMQNHSFSHAKFECISALKAEWEIRKCREVINGITGGGLARFFRPSHGLISIRNMKVAFQCSENIMYWTKEFSSDSQLYIDLSGKIFIGHDDDADIILIVDKTIRFLKERNIPIIQPNNLFNCNLKNGNISY